MIYIKNTQRTYSIDVHQVKDDLNRMLDFLGYPDFAISIWFTTEKTIQHYNMHFRHMNKPTDVLSFPYHADLEPGQRIVADTQDDKNLGDILIAPAYVDKQLADWNQTFPQRLRILLVHSVCHLLGYDHITDAEYDQMQKQEDILIAMLENK
ncbi:MAG TPA: rRNA maturation RNase YbeY [Candidatus Babeliales bacterium]|jgi:rRNA maturation RNase YbeY|nr:rRNA maturation RNase YbeY [Candidatus Babeliales bacterium]